ncbi:MAG: PH domain-containing protein [Cyanobacteria bacterium P01_A01_bin.17]
MGIKEDIYFEGAPHRGDLLINLLMGMTIICLPFTIGAVVRAIWVRYKITSRRVIVTGGWFGRTRSDIIYGEIAKIVTVPRGFGAWGDMVITLDDGSRLEMRAVPNFRDVSAYIEDRIKSPKKTAVAAS